LTGGRGGGRLQTEKGKKDLTAEAAENAEKDFVLKNQGFFLSVLSDLCG
jgi:hypothetical protein